MFTCNQAFYDLKNRLQPLYDEREAIAIAHEIMYFTTGLDKTHRLMKKDVVFTAQEQKKYEKSVGELLSGRPLQYVTGAAWFMGREFIVNEHVLIPRPETEELIQWTIEDSQIQIPNSLILDIGSGSGCIPISLKLSLPGAVITSCDVSSEALGVAKQNAERLLADVNFIHLDFLDTEQQKQLGAFDIIVSNPPYIPQSEKEKLHTNVRDHEPALALFVPDSDALVFYRAIAAFGNSHLADNGYIYCELDAGHALECKALFEANGYKEVTIRKDMHGNYRMLRAKKTMNG